MMTQNRLLLYTISICLIFATEAHEDEEGVVLVVLLARNKAHTLPNFLRYFERLNYPKESLSLMIRSDHNEDETSEILVSWLSKNEENYYSADMSVKASPREYADDETWGYERSMNLIMMKEEALHAGREMGAHFVWYLDLDVFLEDPDVLQKLIDEDKTIVAPMLDSNAAYSNFWGDMTEDFWYKRSSDYLDIVSRKKKGCFPAMLVNSCVLVNLKHEVSGVLSFHRHNVPLCDSYDVPTLDIILFALTAQKNDIDMYICNRNPYGHVLVPDETTESDISVMKRYHLDGSAPAKPKVKITPAKIERNSKFVKTTRKKTKPKTLDDHFNKIYCLHLSSNPNTKKMMTQRLNKVDLSATFVDAFDKTPDLNFSFVDSLNLQPLETEDGESMTVDGVNQFLSHYFIWKDVIENEYEQVVILEDNALFYSSFKDKMATLFKDIERLNIDWDFVYLGRKPIQPYADEKVQGSSLILKPAYSYWSLGYMLSLRGAKKLVDAQPLQKMIDLQEFLPVMYDKHPEEDLSNSFPIRSVNAFAIEPSVIEPGIMEEEEEEEERRDGRRDVGRGHGGRGRGDGGRTERMTKIVSQLFDFQNPEFQNLKRGFKRHGNKMEL